MTTLVWRRIAQAALCALAFASLGQTTTADDTVAESCDIDVYGVFDNSGSMTDYDSTCLAYLQETYGESAYTVENKACWEVIQIYMKAAYKAVEDVCLNAGQGVPRISLTIFRCPNSGKDRKLLLEPTNNVTLIDEAWVKLANQQMSGYSCAYGALDQVQYYINITNEMTNSDLGVPATRADPDALVERYPLIFIFTDGLIGNDADASRAIAAQLRDNENNTVIASDAFPTSKMISRLENYARSSLIFESQDLDTLNDIDFRLGTYIVHLEDLVMCSDEQLNCAEVVKEAISLQRNESASCETMSQLYTSLAACASSGCVGLDLTTQKDECLDDLASQSSSDSSCTPTKACRDLALHINAQNYDYESAPGAGLDSTSATPSFGSRNADASSEASLGSNVQLDAVFSISSYSGGNSAPIVGNTGNIIVGSVAMPDGTAGRVMSIDPTSGEVAWEVTAMSSEVSFEAPAVVGPSDSDDVYIGASDGTFYRISESNGTILQSWNLGARIRAAAAVPADDDYIVVATDAEPGVQPAMLHKLSTASDALEQDPPQSWRRPICSNETYDYVMGGVHIISSQSIIVPCHSGRIERFSYLQGTTEWKITVSSDSVLSSSPYFASSALYMTTYNGTSYVAKLAYLGSITWSTDLTSEVAATPIMNSDSGSIFLLDRTGAVSQLNATDGSVIVDAQTIFSEAPLSTFGMGPDSDGNLIFVAGETLTIANANDLSNSTAMELSSKVTSAPLLGEDGLYLSTNDAVLVYLESGSSAATRRALVKNANSDSQGWPVGAIAATVVLGVVFIVLCVMLALVVRRARVQRASNTSKEGEKHKFEGYYNNEVEYINK